MQRPSTSNQPPLDYLRSSPVRGQLEPHDPRTTKGWRYIQTTDTLNQLKVLLPPGTASMYEQLLKFEAFELGKKSALSWERILEIRHLKDRMIRKCQKLAKAAPARKPGDPFTFQTIIAPPDFRVKEMEKWFQEQQKRTNALLRRPHAHPAGVGNSQCCSRCADRPDIKRDVVIGGSQHLTSSNPHPQLSPVKPNSDRRLPIYQQPRSISQGAPLTLRGEKPPALAPRYKPGTAAASTVLRSVSSPPPLPHLLRIRNLETGYDLSDDPQKIVSMPNDKLTGPGSLSGDESPSNSAEQKITGQNELRRRPSCIKRTSTGDFAKTVSWADDRDLGDQVANYAAVAREAQASGRKWEEIRDIYMDQMTGLEALHQQVEQSIEHLRSESEHLKQADETIRRQREALHSTFRDCEQKQLHFQTKVQEALEDADHILSLNVQKEVSQIEAP